MPRRMQHARQTDATFPALWPTEPSPQLSCTGLRGEAGLTSPKDRTATALDKTAEFGQCCQSRELGFIPRS